MSRNRLIDLIICYWITAVYVLLCLLAFALVLGLEVR